MTTLSSTDLALRLLPIMGLVIPAVAILVTWAVKREYEATAHKCGLISLCLVVLATILDILFIAYNTPTFEVATGAFLASLIALLVSVVMLIHGIWTGKR